MSVLVKRSAPLYLASACAFIVLAEYFVSGVPALTTIKTKIVSYSTTIANFGGIFAIITLLIRYFRPWIRGEKQTRDEKALNLSFWACFIVFGILTITASPYRSMFYTAFQTSPLSTSWATWTIYMLYATYRIFKARDIGTIVFVASMMIWLTKQAPSGPVISPVVNDLGNWLITYPSKGGVRAGSIAYGLGALVLGLRLLILREKGLLERETEAGVQQGA